MILNTLETADPTSAWYVGKVRHVRHQPVTHRFDYSMMMGLFDLDELERLDAGVRGFGVDRHAPIGFHTADHGPADGSPLRPWAADRLADAGLDRAGADGPIRLLCMPRTFGLGFDPITVWFLHDADGSPSAVIHEVRNTFGDRHAYVAPVVDPGRTPWRQSIPKTMHVSPFFDRDGRYDFRIVPPSSTPGSSVSIRIDYRNDDGLLLTASFAGERRPFTTLGMLAAVAHSPAMVQQAVAGINYQALRLWRKGLRYRSVPTAPSQPTTAGTGCPVGAQRYCDSRPPTNRVRRTLKGSSR
ncbi:MAG: DUF1365 domain-containing protein [Candidatus Microthrix subdominans]